MGAPLHPALTAPILLTRLMLMLHAYSAGWGRRRAVTQTALWPPKLTCTSLENAMASVPAPGIIAVEAIWSVENEMCENTFHYHFGGTIDVALLQLIMTTYQTWAAAHLGLWTTVTELVKMQARDLTSTSGASVIDNLTTPVIGTDASTVMPNNVSFALKRQSGIRGRANRGRLFMLGMGQDNLDASQQSLTGAAAANYVTTYTDLLLAQLADSGVTEVILHRALGTSTPVIGYAYSDLFVDSQRRRLPGHNRHH